MTDRTERRHAQTLKRLVLAVEHGRRSGAKMTGS